MPDQQMATGVEADELRARDLAAGVLCDGTYNKIYAQYFGAPPAAAAAPAPAASK